MTEKKQTERLSFADITAEIGDVAIPVADESGSRLPEQEFISFPGGTEIIEDIPVRTAFPEDDTHVRVLTGSSPKPRPMWLDGILSGLLAALFIVPILLRTGMTQYQPWISYMSMFLGICAAGWSLLGLRQVSSQTEKRLCFSGAALGLCVALLAFLFRAPVVR